MQRGVRGSKIHISGDALGRPSSTSIAARADYNAHAGHPPAGIMYKLVSAPRAHRRPVLPSACRAVYSYVCIPPPPHSYVQEDLAGGGTAPESGCRFLATIPKHHNYVSTLLPKRPFPLRDVHRSSRTVPLCRRADTSVLPLLRPRRGRLLLKQLRARVRRRERRLPRPLAVLVLSVHRLDKRPVLSRLVRLPLLPVLPARVDAHGGLRLRPQVVRL
eukprot:3760335-Pyramimonas_sp.AAC.1